MSKLYIIGNGFDLFHGYETSYHDFYQYLSNNAHNNTLSTLDQYWCDIKDERFWSDFEENLGSLLDHESLMTNAEEYSTDITDENPKYNGVEIEVEGIFKVVVDLKKVIIDFIKDVTNNPNPPNADINIDINAKFISFNYSKTLEVI